MIGNSSVYGTTMKTDHRLIKTCQGLDEDTCVDFNRSACVLAGSSQSSTQLLYVLNLFTHLLYQYFEVDGSLGIVGVAGFGTQRISFPVEFLH